MLVESMQKKVDLLASMLESNHFSSKEIAQIAIAMELHATVDILEKTLDMDTNMRYAVIQVYRQHQEELDKTT